MAKYRLRWSREREISGGRFKRPRRKYWKVVEGRKK